MRRKIIVNDPIHKVMRLGSSDRDRSTLKAVIDTQEFQRLRRISQLGLASFVFPGASHTRFCHSLGTAYLAKCVLDHLLETHVDDDLTIKQLEKHKVSVILAALLHDVGHGPFSHSFEKVLKGFGEIKKYAPMHEDWSAAFIKNQDSKLSKALRLNGFDPDLLASVFIDDSDSKFPQFLKQIVSSQLDVDRMDYLLRDSHFAGVSVGEFDVQYLINCLTIINHDRRNARTLGLTKKGVKVFESYAIARQLMNRSVYYHGRIKVLEFMVEEFTRGIISSCRPIQKTTSLKNLVPSYFCAVNELIQASGKSHPQKNEFIKANYGDYVDLTEAEVWTLIAAVNRTVDRRVPAQLRSLAKNLLMRQPLEHKFIQSGKESLLKTNLEIHGFEEKVDFVIIDLSSTIYKKSTEDKVFVAADHGGAALEITSHSELISAFHDKAESESLLILIDPQKKRIFEYAEELRAVPVKGRSKKTA